jgi:hypothetical protein
MSDRLLINWVYYQPVGHAVEALRFAQSWRNANPELWIGLALNCRSAVELTACVPGVDAVYPVDLDEFVPGAERFPSLEQIPAEWEYIFTDPRHEAPMGSEALDRCEQVMRARLTAGLRNDGWTLPDGFPSTAFAPLALRLPASARQFAAEWLGAAQRPRVCLLLGSGTEASRTPPLGFWRLLIGGLLERIPGLELILLGATDAARSITQGVDRAAIDGLLAACPALRDGFDLGLLNQLAIAERCQLLISPHTGLGFATQAVGLPWLVLSGSWAAENWVNGVPLVSIYPDCPRYPCDPWSPAAERPMLEECRVLRQHGSPYGCLTAEALTAKLPAILEAAGQLLAGELPAHICAQRHYAAMIPRLGRRPGEPFLEGWPEVLEEPFRFRPQL